MYQEANDKATRNVQDGAVKVVVVVCLQRALSCVCASGLLPADLKPDSLTFRTLGVLLDAFNALSRCQSCAVDAA